MADTPAAAPSGPRANKSAARGRRRGGGGGGGNTGRAANNSTTTATSNDHQTFDTRGGGRGRRGGRNRGRGGAQVEGGHNGEGGPPPDTGLQPDGTSGDRLAGDASNDKGEGKSESADQAENKKIAAGKGMPEEESDDDDETESPFVIFTDDTEKSYGDFDAKDFVRTDDNLGIRYESQQIFADTVLLLRYNCPDKKCDVACLGWPDLHHHVKSRHGRSMCDLCTRNKKVFTHEHELFTVNQLRKHEKYGDHVPGAAEQSGFKGHPECGFCRVRFYGDDELYAHCRDKHERCHICDRRRNGQSPQYFVNYDALEEHFKHDHYLCLDKECLEKKFVVFENQMDLKAHRLEEHPNSMSKDERRGARHVDMGAFNVRSNYETERPRRGAGRGRDPNAEPLPVSSAQPLRRDELAYHRQMAIQSAQSVTSRTFGGQLTTGGPSRAPPTPASRTPAQVPSRTPSAAPTPPIQNLSISGNNTTTAPHVSPSLRDQARQLAHAGVINRAAIMLKNDQLKLDNFKNKVSAYRTGRITATHMIDGFFSLFDTSPDDVGKLIKELAELYENESQRLGLLKAWNDWRAINEDYPALPGAGGNYNPSSTAGATGSGGARVLMLKNTAAAGRSPSARNTIASVSSNSAFPPLPSSSGTRSSSSKPLATGVAARSGYTSANLSAASSRSSSRAPQPGPSRSADAFPALPAAPKPNTLMAGLTRGTRRWDSPGPQQSAWTSDPASAAGSEYDMSESSNAGGGGKKGKGKKKQVLYHFG
ncbi:hypothetical protein KEM56_001727 [Ascosphaera pollenicola]|nr:hypothetical protein KEM56_001727 [Ascosphaera pollenicola]